MSDGVEFLIGVILGAVIVGMPSTACTDAAWQRDAVKHGHAEWRTDEHGNPQWAWKDTPEPAPAREGDER